MELIAKENKALKQVSENGNVVYALRVTTYNPESWEEVDIAEYNEWKRKQEEEEKRLAEQKHNDYMKVIEEKMEAEIEVQSVEDEQ